MSASIRRLFSSNATVPGFNLSINGGRPGSTLILADGANNTGVSLARAVLTFSPETVQEFTVQTSAYSAEYGRTGGGIINATTKSGTNSFNGTALAYIRNPAVAAAPWTNATSNRPVATLRSNQFSLAAGGPVVLPKKFFGPLGYDGRDKSFFFAAIEPYYRIDHITAVWFDADAGHARWRFQQRRDNAQQRFPVPVPSSIVSQFPGITFNNATIYQTVALVNSNQFQLLPAAQITPFANNKIPSNFLDPSAQKALQYVPFGGSYFIDPNGQLENFVVTRFTRQDDKRYTMKFDQNLTEKKPRQLPPVADTGGGAKRFR